MEGGAVRSSVSGGEGVAAQSGSAAHVGFPAEPGSSTAFNPYVKYNVRAERAQPFAIGAAVLALLGFIIFPTGRSIVLVFSLCALGACFAYWLARCVALRLLPSRPFGPRLT